jgi:hypothetical protein
MKRTVLLFSTCVISGLSAQTLTQGTHEPVVGDVENIRRLDTSMYSSGIPLQATGANALWDFSQATPANTTTMVNNYVAPNTYTHNTLFTGATVVQNLDGKMFNYFKSSTTPTTQAEIVGIYTSTLALTFTNSALVIQYPASLGFSISDPVSGTYTMGAFNGPLDGNSSTMADGTGTLMLSGGATYTDVIRVKTVQTLTLTQGSLTGVVMQTVYNFYSASKKFPLINVSYISVSMAGGPPSVMAGMYRNNDSFVTGVKEVTGEPVGCLFPNPATDRISFNLREEVAPNKISVYDVTGSKVMTVRTATAAGQLDLNVSSLHAGVYLLQVEGARTTTTKRFVVTR